MTNKQKSQISDQLRRRKETSSMSDAQLANAIGTSNTTINFIINARWENDPKCVSDEMFRRVASWLGVAEEWVINMDDINFRKIQSICEKAKRNSDAYAVAENPGFCKTESAKHFSTQPNVFYIKCSQHYTKKVFLSKIIQAMGMHQLPVEGINEMVERITQKLNTMHKPLLIIDEADKLSDNLFQFFITFYNDTQTSCGFVFLGSRFFEIRVRKGVNKNHQGYAEFFSRIGGEFKRLQNLTEDRVTRICKMNGLHDPTSIKEVYNTCNNDLRRVKRAVESAKSKLETAAKQQLTLEEA